ncbi:gliding motility-associated lipoprotein GldH [Pustulibacterium marinum]|uniref:Gliding motility-associated lipoprotein GldH n=1 Tax=Pustulibacterium marinum TaxID=1224947 RepID=A0A1I7EUC2_9FLAO|nr:gliding motility lipoprotein GldH [Pustulibacterium marinum]SFU27488.1 gliding motility-associated lipoprotein GldH [Pustulibacterium marinum]
MLRNQIKFLLFSCLLGVVVSCDNATIYSETKAIEGTWNRNDTIQFHVQSPDTINPYNIFINLRNNEDYAYSNLYMIVEMEYPDGNVVSDTLQYEMAKPNGEFLGEGFTGLKENKLWYKGMNDGFVFPKSGDYTIDILQAMRKNGSVKGIIALDGVTDVGISIEKIAKE